MAQGNSSVNVPEVATGIPIETMEMESGKERQVVVLGDPFSASGVAPVDATTGLAVHQVGALPAGNNNIGNVDIATMPTVEVDILTMPSLPAGANAIGKLAANSGVTIGRVEVASGQTLDTVTNVTNVGSINTSVTPGVGATNLGKAEDAAHTSGDVGVMALAVRNDAGTALAGTTGDYNPLSTDSNGALRVSGGGGGTQFAEDTAHVSGDIGTEMLAVRRDANTSLVTSDGDYAPIQVDANGAVKVAIITGAGTGGTSAGDGSTFTPGSTSMVPIGGIYEASPTALADGKVGVVEVDSSRNLLVHEQYAPAAEDNTNQVIATQARPVSGSTYAAPLTGAAFGTDVDISIKNAAGNLLAVIASSKASAITYLQVHNKASAPSAGNVPLISLPIPIGSTTPQEKRLNRNDWGDAGKYLSTGVSIGISTTEATFTAATPADHDLYYEAI